MVGKTCWPDTGYGELVTAIAARYRRIIEEREEIRSFPFLFAVGRFIKKNVYKQRAGVRFLSSLRYVKLCASSRVLMTADLPPLPLGYGRTLKKWQL
jgi:hypothetical protein